jgi:hypothetical protein
MSSIFGPIVTGYDLEVWTLQLCRKWFGTYLSEMERQHGLTAGTFKRPLSYTVAPSFDKFPEDQLPAIVLVSAGLAEQPAKQGDGNMHGRWDLLAGGIVSARRQDEAHAMAQFYCGALRWLLIQRPSLDGHAQGVVWMDEDYTMLEFDETRSLAAGVARFTVEVENVSNAKAGPLTPEEPLDPDTLPWPPWQTVDDVIVEVEHQR